MELQLIVFKDGKVGFSKDEFASIKPFATLIGRDKGGIFNIDPEGKLKLRAYAELGVIWWTNNHLSPGIQQGLKGKELLNDAKSNFNLPDTWIPDDIFNAANRYYIEHNNNVAKDLYISILRGLRVTNKYIDRIVDSIEQQMDKDDLNANDYASLATMFKTVLDMADLIPKKIDAIQKAKDLIDKNKEDDVAMQRGKKEAVLPSMNIGGDPGD